MNIDFDKLVNNVSKVKLPGGVFGKTCTVVIIVSLSMFGIAWITKNIWISSAALGMIFILTFTILWRLINFANKNPQAAILEGAEFLIHEQMQLAAKGHPQLSESLSNFIEGKIVILDEKTIKSANKPDNIMSSESEVSNG